MEATIKPLLTREEVSFSQTATRKGIPNLIPDAEFKNALILNDNIVKPLREKFPDLKVSSWYRSPALNKAISGSPTSQHMEGKAVDLITDNNSVLFHYIRENMDYDQIIWEFGDKAPAWVHVSFDEKNNRKQALKAVRLKTKTIYRPWIY